jgi:hypothetical protein
LLVDGVHEGDQVAGRLRIEIGRRFVGDHQGRVGDQGSRHGHALLLAARHAVRPVKADGRQADPRKALQGLFAGCRCSKPLNLQRQHHIFNGRQYRDQVVALKNEPDEAVAQPGARVVGHRSKSLTFQQNFTGTGGVYRPDQI